MVKRLKIRHKNLSKKFVKKICQKNSSQKFVTKIRQNKEPKEPQGHQSNEFYIIYKSGPFMLESRFLEAPLVRQADGELKKSSVYHPIFSYTWYKSLSRGDH